MPGVARLEGESQHSRGEPQSHTEDEPQLKIEMGPEEPTEAEHRSLLVTITEAIKPR